MNLNGAPVIDCDMHPLVPNANDLIPYLSPQWQEAARARGLGSFESIAYPPRAPLSGRPEWRGDNGLPAFSFESYRDNVLDPWNVRYAIANVLYGVPVMMSEDMAAAFSTAINDWMIDTWLSRDSRMRASIVVPWQNPQLAAEEIDRRAGDKRFVQVLLPAAAEAPYGRRHFWPLFAAAERHGLPVGIHAGSSYRFPVTPVGWPTYYVEDYAANTLHFQAQVASLLCEGTFGKFPGLKIVLMESGVSWWSPYIWRLNKFWRGTRLEIPWVDRPPVEVAREHFRMTIHPFDAPADPSTVARIVDHLESDEMLLFSTDYPHWQFEEDVVPEGFPAAAFAQMTVDNAVKTYPNLKG